MNTIKFEEKKYIILFVRFAIGIAFLSAVADRFGIWGNPGGENVAWGNFENFVAYVTYLNPFLSNTLNIVLAWVVTFIEVILAGMLILGFRLQLASLLSGVLLLSFALKMADNPEYNLAPSICLNASRPSFDHNDRNVSIATTELITSTAIA